MPLTKIMWEEEREEFRREGREEERKKAALKMLQEKIDVETICRCMNLTAWQVEELKKRL